MTLDNGGTLATSTGSATYAGGITLTTAGANFSVAGTQLTLSGVINDAASTFGITKTGAGILTLSNANTYDGVTAVNAGTLRVTANDALGSMTNGTSVAAGAELDVQSTLYTTAEALTLDNGATLRTSTGTSSYAGNITLTTASAAIAVDGVRLTLSGVIDDGGSTFGINKSGNAILELTNTNTYDGVTAINGGTIIVTADGALGSASGGTTIVSGATLAFDGGVTYSTAEAVSVTGTGMSPNGAISNINGTNSFAGAITLTGATEIRTRNTGTLTLSGNITGGGNTLDVKGVNTGSITFSGAISGVSTLTLDSIVGTASFSGDVDVATLAVDNTNLNVAFTGNGSSVTNAVAFANMGTLALGTAGGTQTYMGGLSTTGVGGLVTLNGTINTAGQALTLGAVTLGSTTTLDTSNGGGSVGGAALTVGAVTGAGTTLNIDSGNANNASLGQIGSAGNALTALVLSGSSAALNGDVFADSHTYNGNLTLGANSVLTAAAGNTLAFSGSVAAGANTLTIVADEVNFGGGANTVSGTNTLTIQSVTAGDNLNIGGADVGANTLDILAGDIAAIAEGFSGIIFWAR